MDIATVVITGNIKAERLGSTWGGTHSIWALSIKYRGEWDKVGEKILRGELATRKEILAMARECVNGNADDGGSF